MYSDADLLKFMQSTYPWFMDTYNAYPHNIQRVDAARYFLLRKYVCVCMYVCMYVCVCTPYLTLSYPH